MVPITGRARPFLEEKKVFDIKKNLNFLLFTLPPSPGPSQVHYVFLLEICGDLVIYTFFEMILNKEFDEQCFHLLKQICGGYLGFSKWWL